MRDLERGVIRRDVLHFTGYPVKTLGILVLASPCRHQLHTHAYAHERACFMCDRFDHCCIKARMAFQLGHAGGESTIAGQHNAVGTGHHVGIACHDDVARARFQCHTLKRFLR